MKAAIIGGGIIGLSSAYYLQKRGWDVTVMDRSDLLDNCSYGNLGMIVPSHFVPLAAPGMVAQGIRWMFDNKSPFYVKPVLDMDLISWGWKFLKSASAKNVEKAAIPLLQLNQYSKELYEELARQPGFDFGFERRGILMYYKSEKTQAEEVHLAGKARTMGLDVDVLTKDQVMLLEPGTELDILGAIHYKSDAHLYPNHLIQQLIHHLEKAGVRILRNCELKNVIVKDGAVRKAITDKSDLDADVFVMANGSWLPATAKKLHIRIPLMPGKGYSFTDKHPEQKLNIPAILCEARVAITPMNGFMRYGGTMEIGSINDNINLTRVEGIVQSIPGYFPGFRLTMPGKSEIWYGFRPVTPDGLPYLGYSRKLKNVIIAGGHAMMGLSLGPASGKIVADLASGEQPGVDITAFRVDRFS